MSSTVTKVIIQILTERLNLVMRKTWKRATMRRKRAIT
jgi:hypothetical protein